MDVFYYSLSANDDSRLQILDRVILYPYNTRLGRMCKAN